MALTGSIETNDGVLHERAFGKVYPVQTEMHGGRNRFYFELHIWHTEEAHDDGKNELRQSDLPRNFEISDPQLMAAMINATYQNIVAGNPATPEEVIALMVSSTVLPAEDYLLSLPEFAGWTKEV